MQNLQTDPRDEFVLRLTPQEACAIEKCLRAERELQMGSSERVRCIHFGRATPRPFDGNEHELQVRVWERSSLPDRVILEVRRALADELRELRQVLPRRALRPAMRANAIQELSPGLPHDLVPMLGIEMSRRTWNHPAGWWASLDRDIALHRLHPRSLERTGRILMGIPDKFVDGAIALTVARNETMLPDWLEHVLGASAPWDLFREGLALTAPRPSGARALSGLRLVLQ